VDGILADVPTTIDPINAVSSAGERNSYDFRLVVSRKLYDLAVGTTRSPSLSHLAPGTGAHLHPLDIARASAVAGSDVTLTSPRGQLVLRAVPDESVLRGTVRVPFNQPGVNIGDIIDCTADVIDVRIENL
jgi:NADH-quinone oxidoreductase subunit G